MIEFFASALLVVIGYVIGVLDMLSLKDKESKVETKKPRVQPVCDNYSHLKSVANRIKASKVREDIAARTSTPTSAQKSYEKVYDVEIGDEDFQVRKI
tara:strand:- start:301 stop:594 length:294 start_codon:yes stop_codon:yes gene_type:complete